MFLEIGFWFSLTSALGQEPPRLGPPLLLTNRAIQITVTGQAGKYHRVDVSTNLTRWGSLEIVRTTNGTARLVDNAFQTLPLRFYRAAQVEPATELQRLSVNVGSPGTKVAIEGQFFSPGQPGDNVVTLGDTPLKVLEATPSRLLVEIPEGASSGALLVTTPNGTSLKSKPFTVTSPAVVQLEPPPGMQIADFNVVNTYGRARPASTQSTQQVVTVRRGRPLLTVAAPKDTNRQTYFYAVTVTDAQPVTLGATSTAEALVFLNPLLLTSDAFLAEQTLAAIRQDTNVQQLARVITQLYPQDRRPLQNTNFLKAYADAVNSASKAPRLQAAARALGKQTLPGTAPGERRAALNSMDLEYVAIEGSGRIRKAEAGSGSVPPYTNPVDWLVIFEEVDSDRAFPQGRFDFDHAVNERRKLVNYPVRGDFRETRSVEAELLTGNLDIVETLIGKLSDWLQNSIWDDAIEFPDRDAIYIVRAIGPSFSIQEEFDFVTDHFPEERTRVWFINVLHIVMDLISAAADLSGDEDEEFIEELAQDLEIEFSRKAPQVQSKEDLGRLAFDLATKASERVTRSTIEWLVDAAVPLLKALDVIASFGQAAERFTGFGRTTPLETGFIMVGDPFRLEIESLSPTGAAPGDEMLIVINGAQLDPQNRADAVYFSVAGFQGRVVRAQDLGERRQQLAVRLPDELAELESGEHTVSVVAQGRRGEAAFQLFNRPTVTQMSPTEGFAAADSFLVFGQQFEGTEVSLTGIGFSPEDKFIFGGGIEATSKMGSQGNVTLRVPKGAASSPVTIRRQFASEPREGQSPPFTVYGAPVIERLSPEAGPVGTLVIFSARNLGRDPALIRVVFSGASPLEGHPLEGNRLAVRVPLDLQSGPVRLLTPAGVAEHPFTVQPGRAPGSVIEVGGRSVVSLQRALDFARGAGLPKDDADFLIDPKTGERTPLDPPFEEGDFVTPIQPGPMELRDLPVGALFADTILVSGEVAESGEFGGEFDRLRTPATINLTNAIRGTITLTGTNNEVDLVIRGSAGHGLIIRGLNNRVSGDCSNNAGDGLRIEGGAFNIINVFAAGNGSNGITLTQGASGNEVGSSSLDNRGHGVALLEDASANIVRVFAARNGRDGVFLSGTKVRQNQISNGASENTGHGLLITDGANDNDIGLGGIGLFVARKNGKSGVALIGDTNINPRRTQVTAQCNENSDYGFLVSGVVDDWANTHISLTSLDFSTGQLLYRGNRKADLRLENNVSGLHFFGTLGGGAVGIELDGNNVISNLIGASIEGSTSHGVTVTNARLNRLHLSVANCGGTGVLLSGAVSNFLSVAALENLGDGLVLTDGARANRLFLQWDAPPLVGTNAFVGNRNGMVLEGGAHDNVLHDFVSNANREHGVLLRGRNTSGNQITKAVIGRRTGQIPAEALGNGGDGIRIEGGASDNAIGAGAGHGVDTRNSAGAGIRISGLDTRNISVVGSAITLGDRVQEAGIVVENQAADCVIGSRAPQQGNLISRNADGVIVRSGARRISLVNNRVESNLTNGVLVEAASEVFIGDRGSTGDNQISRNAIGIQLRRAGTTNVRVVNNSIFDNGEGILLVEGASQNTIEGGNVLTGNRIGIRGRQTTANLIVGNIIQLSQGAAVHFADGATVSLLHNNTIRNNGRGVEIDGATAVRNSLRHNSITANGGKGVALFDNANAGITPPVIREFRAGVINGTVNAPNGSIVEIFLDPAGEGAQSLVSVPCLNGRFQATVQLFLRGIWIPDELTCTVTDLDGNTSEFGRFEPGRTSAPSQIAFSSTGDGNPEIYFLRSFTAQPTRLTSDSADDHSPAFAPNGREIAFVSTRTGNAELFLMTLEPGAGARQLTTNPAADYDPAWSSDGTKIIFVSERAGNPDIYVIDASGGTAAPIIAEAGIDRSPSFSPDGKRIVFASNRTGNFEIFLAEADGRNARAITQNAAVDTQPNWSPSGDFIAFVSNRDGNSEIYTMRSDGSGVTRLTNDPASDLNPSWLADGSGLVFASDRDAGYELYVRKTTGGEAVRLTVSDGDNTSPSVARR